MLTQLTPLKRAPRERSACTPTNRYEFGALVEDLKVENSCGILATYNRETAQAYIPDRIRLNFPDPLRKLYNPAFAGKPLPDLVEEAARILPTLQLSKGVCEAIERATKKQSKTKLWHELRQGRITASIVKKVIRMSLINPPNSLLVEICHAPTKPIGSETHMPASLKYVSLFDFGGNYFVDVNIFILHVDGVAKRKRMLSSSWKTSYKRKGYTKDSSLTTQGSPSPMTILSLPRLPID